MSLRSPCRLLLPIIFLAAGCGAPQDCDARLYWIHGDGSVDSLETRWFHLFAGSAAELEIDLVAADRRCVAGNTPEHSAKVLDPNGATVPSELSADSSQSMSGALVDGRLRFEPTLPGIHVLVLEHEGQLEAERYPFLVSKPAAEERPVVRTFARPCTSVARTTAGAWLCDGSVYREGVSVQTLGGTQATSGAVVWAVNAADAEQTELLVTRYVDDGTGPLRSEPLSGVTLAHAPVAKLLATDTELIVVTESGASRFLYDPTDGLVAAGSIHFEENPATAAARDGDLLRVASRRPGEGVGVCTFEISAGGFAPSGKPCQSFDGDAGIASDGASFWSFDASVFTRFDPDGSDVVATKIRPPHPMQGVLGPAGPVWLRRPGAASLVSRFAEGRIYFEEFVTPGSAPFSVSETFAVEHYSVGDDQYSRVFEL